MSDFSIAFDHVHLISEDPQLAASWYADKMGGEIVSSHEVRGAAQILVAFKGATIIVRGQRPGEQPDRKMILIDDEPAAIRKKGVTFTVDPMDFSPSVRIAFIETPDGVSIELLQRKG